jgi:peptide chain release factor 1
MLKKLDKVISRHSTLHRMLSNPQVVADREHFEKLAREYRELSEIVKVAEQYRALCRRVDEDQDLLSSSDEELAELAQEEIGELTAQRQRLEEKLALMLVPNDPRDKGDAIVEIRAGTGGEEASLFAADLVRMYTRFAERQGWRIEMMGSNPTEIGGFKEIVFAVEGAGAYGKMKYESGVHRVQRVPITESSGRIHTSAASVVVLPEPEEVEVQIDPKDLRVDVFRSSGPGGQSVNTTDSAVRITHIPTGIMATCQDEKSQHKNKAKALKVLRARLLDQAQKERRRAVDQSRKTQVGTGDRSAKIRTYNFPQGRLTDHRVGLTLYKLEQILAGELEEVIEALMASERKERLQELEEASSNQEESRESRAEIRPRGSS